MEPEDGTELLQGHDKILINEKCLHMDDKRKRFLEMEFSAHEDAVKIAEITKYLQYINLVYKTAAGFEYFDSNFERCFTMTKMLINSITCYRL